VSLLNKIWGSALFGLCLVPPVPAQNSPKPTDLADKSIEDLMNIEVTSVSKTEQKMSQAAAAIFVITQEDIRRSGVLNIQDLLRMVPGLDVSQINANQWAISSRGFNTQFVNKMLVLIDGRAVYTPLLGGVNWDTQDVPLEDIDRIEVIRGPGATLWGANAVNGVINVTTKRPADTRGGLISASGGTEKQELSTVQYGGTILANTSYRVFTKHINHDSLPETDGSNGTDGWHLLHGGFRADTNIRQSDYLTLQGDLYTGNEGATIVHVFSIDPPNTDFLDTRVGLSGGNLLGRWNHNFSSRSDTSFQFYFDNNRRTGPSALETGNALDFEFNHHVVAGEHEDIVWGVGYRRTWDRTQGTIDQAFTPSDKALQLFNSFVQDTFTLDPNQLFLTVGTKLEHFDYGGFGIEPSARLTWTPSSRQTYWAAVSRANRSPARRDEGLEAALGAFPDPGGSTTPLEVIVFGNPQIKPEHILAYEAGFRAQPNARFSIDIAAFYNRYTNLVSLEPEPQVFEASPPPARFVAPIVFRNELNGSTAGGEIAANLKVTNRWTVSPSYALLKMHLHTDSGSQDTISVPDYEGSNPQHQAQLRSHVELHHGLEWDAAAYFVSSLPFQQVAPYARLDTQLRWKAGERLEFSLVGQNLLRDHHLESLDFLTLVNSSLVKRKAYGRMSLLF
jgi:iron complex outermembrane receptor protein